MAADRGIFQDDGLRQCNSEDFLPLTRSPGSLAGAAKGQCTAIVPERPTVRVTRILRRSPQSRPLRCLARFAGKIVPGEFSGKVGRPELWPAGSTCPGDREHLGPTLVEHFTNHFHDPPYRPEIHASDQVPYFARQSFGQGSNFGTNLLTCTS